MPRAKRVLSELQEEAKQLDQEVQLVFYLVELTWNDGTRTAFVIHSPTREHAIHAVEVRALSMWTGYVVSNRVEVIPIPEAPNLPTHVYTDLSGYSAEKVETVL